MGGSGNPSESRASISSRQEPGRVGADTDRLTLCPVRVARLTSDHVGAAGSAGAELDLGEVGRLIVGLMPMGRVSLDWEPEHVQWPKDWAKLLMNATLLAADALPRRMAFIFVPNGVHLPDWTPEKDGADFELPKILEPLAPVKDQLLVFSNLAQAKAFPNGDGPGDHARALASFLTGCQAFKTNGANIRVGASVDQVAAQQISAVTVGDSD